MVINRENEEEKMLLYQMYLQDRNFTGPGILLTASFEIYPDTIPRILSVNSDSEDKQTNTGKSFKSGECVICLTKPPNVLFCNCGHVVLCVECNKVKSLNACPVCKTKSTIKRTIE